MFPQCGYLLHLLGDYSCVGLVSKVIFCFGDYITHMRLVSVCC
jgi:hypothetical protein